MRRVPLVLVLVLLASPAYAQEHLALITELDGSVSVERADGTRANAVWGVRLFAGDVVVTGSDGSASLLFSDGGMLTLGSGTRQVVEGGNGSDSVDPALLADVSDLTLQRTGVGEIAALGGLRSGGGDRTIDARYPRETRVRGERPNFSWSTGSAFDSFTVIVFDDDGEVWRGSTAETSLEYPASAPALEAGRSYYWRVEGEELLDVETSALFGFDMMDAEARLKVQQAEADLKVRASGGTSLSYLLGSLYVRHGLNHEAVQVFSEIASEHPEAAMVHEILGRLYYETGRKDEAVAALQKALELSRSSDR